MDFAEHTARMIVSVAQASNPDRDPVQIAADALGMALEVSEDPERDYAEEAYWRKFCQACGTSPCESEDDHESERIAEDYAEAAADYAEQESQL